MLQVQKRQQDNRKKREIALFKSFTLCGECLTLTIWLLGLSSSSSSSSSSSFFFLLLLLLLLLIFTKAHNFVDLKNNVNFVWPSKSVEQKFYYWGWGNIGIYRYPFCSNIVIKGCCLVCVMYHLVTSMSKLVTHSSTVSGSMYL